MRQEDAKSGVKVRCVDDTFTSRKIDPVSVHDLNLPKEGEFYTIREVVDTYEGHPPGLLFVEVINRKYNYKKGGYNEPCFSLNRFELA